MRLVFAGTPEFAAKPLAALHQAGHDIALVLTQPDRPAGRGLRPVPSAVKRLALDLGLSIELPPTLKDEACTARLSSLGADAMIVAAYGLILPAAVLAIPRLGCINIHASLLPRWRGAAPIQRAILAGDDRTGISIMQMDAGLDTGPVRLQEMTAILPDDTAGSLHDRLAEMGSRLIVKTLESPTVPVAQDDSLATYAAKIDKAEARLNFSETADLSDKRIRAFNPVPGATTTWRGGAMKVWRSRIAGAQSGHPGVILRADRDGITVACGDGQALSLLELQRAGGRRLDAAAFLAGVSLKPGDRFGD
jgi:methionyl-tRNA formyltransferase